MRCRLQLTEAQRCAAPARPRPLGTLTCHQDHSKPKIEELSTGWSIQASHSSQVIGPWEESIVTDIHTDIVVKLPTLTLRTTYKGTLKSDAQRESSWCGSDVSDSRSGVGGPLSSCKLLRPAPGYGMCALNTCVFKDRHSSHGPNTGAEAKVSGANSTGCQSGQLYACKTYRVFSRLHELQHFIQGAPSLNYQGRFAPT